MKKVAASFRDPSGFVYWEKNAIHRYVDKSYFDSYNTLIDSGLYAHLVEKKMLISHKTLISDVDHMVLEPSLVPFVSYPYEWSFSQLKDAALLTLSLQKEALLHGMTLKDASVYNVQFVDGAPIFIDTLSFERYQEGAPWIAYKQFCQHFLAPLALMSYVDVRLSSLFKNYIDGIPLDLASSLLPVTTYVNMSLLLHIHLHARTQKKYEDTVSLHTQGTKKLSRTQVYGLLDSLQSGIEKLTYKAANTQWVDYYQDDSYTKQGLLDKERIIKEYLHLADSGTVWDLGGNDGFFSRIAALYADTVLCFDIDPACVENNYLQVKKHKDTKIVPLLLDLTNPSASIGWANTEREVIEKRGTADCVMALALIHHLALSCNIPLSYCAEYFARLGNWLIIEFVPKSDKKVKKLLATRADIFDEYTLEGFKTAFEKYYEIKAEDAIVESDRVLFLLKRK